MNKFILFLLTLGFIAIKGNAQLKYHSNGELTFGDISANNYTTRFDGWGRYLSYGNHFLEVVSSNANPRIVGTGNQIFFYIINLLTTWHLEE